MIACDMMYNKTCDLLPQSLSSTTEQHKLAADGNDVQIKREDPARILVPPSTASNKISRSFPTITATNSDDSTIGAAPIKSELGEQNEVIDLCQPTASKDVDLQEDSIPIHSSIATDDEMKAESANTDTVHTLEAQEVTLPGAESVGLVERGVPSNPHKILTFCYHPKYTSTKPNRIIAVYVAKLSRPVELELHDRQATYDVLKSFSMLTTITPAIEKALDMKLILNSILGENPLKKRPYNFPEPFPGIAAEIMERVQEELGFEEEPAETTPPAPEPVSTKKSKKRKRRSESPRPPARSNKRTNIDPNAPEFGGMLHNLLPTATGFRIKDISQAIDCKQWGENGLQVGAWWPFQHCAVRDGAHGAPVGGIAGGAFDGAKSIVVGGGMYEGMDQDQGDVIYYSGSNSHTNEDPVNPIISHNTKGLMRSRIDHRKIRVLRKAGGSWKHAPSAGLRYDGLYRITGEETMKNALGGAYKRFILQRCPGQAPIDTSRPTNAEKAFLQRWKEAI